MSEGGFIASRCVSSKSKEDMIPKTNKNTILIIIYKKY